MANPPVPLLLLQFVRIRFHIRPVLLEDFVDAYK